MRRTGQRGLLAVALVASSAGLLNLPASAGSTSLSGRYTSSPVAGPACSSPEGFCTAGSLTGGLKGTFTFTATDLIPTVDTPTTGVLAYIGDLVVTTKEGTLTCKDAGVLRSTGPGEVSSVCVVIGGTGDFAGASGSVQFRGTFTGEAGGGGDYTAAVEGP